MEPQAPDTQPQPQKKKLGPLAWVLIGCLGIVILVGGAMLVGGFFVAKKVKDFTDEAKENPARAAAEMVVRVNPELELVETDDEAQTMTLRNTETGEVVTADWSDIKEGRFRMEADGKQVTFDAKEVTTGDAGGMISATDDSGDESAVIGGDDAHAVPAWFPRYPATSVTDSVFSSKSDAEATGMFTLKLSDGVDDVMAFYRDELTALGFDIDQTTYTMNGGRGGSLSGTDEHGRTVELNMIGVVGDGADETHVGVKYTEQKP